jgi:tetratricopeptide (TPR) repeat protein
VVSVNQQEQFQSQYQAGRLAFEKGQYRQSVQLLESACELVPPATRISGEARFWLVTAYQAAGRVQDAIALCRQLSRHPHPDIRKQGSNLLYILEAPRLKRPEEWMTVIPDLSKTTDTGTRYLQATGSVKSPAKRPKPVVESLDLTQVNTKDNRFIWVALLLLVLILGGLVWWS